LLNQILATNPHRGNERRGTFQYQLPAHGSHVLDKLFHCSQSSFYQDCLSITGQNRTIGAWDERNQSGQSDRARYLGLPEPRYEELPGHLRFVVPTKHAEIKAGTGSHQEDALSDPSHQVTESEAKLLRRVAKVPVSRAELIDTVGQ